LHHVLANTRAEIIVQLIESRANLMMAVSCRSVKLGEMARK